MPPAVRKYLIVAFSISWGAFVVRRVGTWGSGIDEALRLAVKFGPSLAGIWIAAVYGGTGGVGRLATRIWSPLPSARWIGFAFGVPLVLLVCALGARAIAGAITPLDPMPFKDGVVMFGALLATRFFLGGGLGEEFGWRGVMLPLLQDKHGVLVASVYVGLAHGVWHLPAYGPAVVFLTLFTVSGSIVFAWMYNRTGGNLFLPALMHATANASLPFVERLVPAVDGEVGYPLLVFVMWAMVAGFLVWRVGIARFDAVIWRGRAF